MRQCQHLGLHWFWGSFKPIRQLRLYPWRQPQWQVSWFHIQCLRLCFLPKKDHLHGCCSWFLLWCSSSLFRQLSVLCLKPPETFHLWIFYRGGGDAFLHGADSCGIVGRLLMTFSLILVFSERSFESLIWGW